MMRQRLETTAVEVDAAQSVRSDHASGPIIVLMVAFEAGRWGPCRMPRGLLRAGFRVFALCPKDNALAKTRFLHEHFPLDEVQSSRRIERRLVEAMATSRAELVIPCDERTVACLQSLVRRAVSAKGRRLSPAMLRVLIDSLGEPRHFNELLLKSCTLALARHIGVRTPESHRVASLEMAVKAAERIGYPVYVKISFSWSGMGVWLCQDRDELIAAVRACMPTWPVSFVKRTIKSWLHQDWYPIAAPIDVQKAVSGSLAMYNVAAWKGKTLAGFAARRHGGASAEGPSSTVWLGANPLIEEASRAMVAALEASGLINFDFIVENKTGDVYLLECNPRPSQVMHLDERVGVDLFGALASALRGGARNNQPLKADGEIVSLFPQAWLGAANAILDHNQSSDAPLNDPDLLAYMLNACARAPVTT